MVQVFEKEKEPKYSILLEEIIIVEELPMEEEPFEEAIVVEREIALKKSLLKLLDKAKFNAKYLKDTRRIEDVKNKIHFRNYAVY